MALMSSRLTTAQCSEVGAPTLQEEHNFAKISRILHEIERI